MTDGGGSSSSDLDRGVEDLAGVDVCTCMSCGQPKAEWIGIGPQQSPHTINLGGGT
jgi:hypothetical protein